MRIDESLRNEALNALNLRNGDVAIETCFHILQQDSGVKMKRFALQHMGLNYARVSPFNQNQYLAFTSGIIFSPRENVSLQCEAIWSRYVSKMTDANGIDSIISMCPNANTPEVKGIAERIRSESCRK